MPTLKRARLVAVLLSLATAIGPANASEGFALRTLELAPAGDRFFSLPDASVKEGLQPAASLAFDWIDHPLVLRQGSGVIPNGELVQRQFAFLLGASLSVADHALIDVSVPFVASRSGQTPFPGTSAVSGTGIEDIRLGARYALRHGELLAVAAGLRLWLPTGDQASFGSDGTVRAEPQLLASGRLGPLLYAGDVGFLLRKEQTAAYADVGSAVTAGASLGVLLFDERLQVGPEVYGRMQFKGSDTSPVEGLLAARWRQGNLLFGGALGTSFGPDTAGAAPLKVVFQMTWAAGGRPAQVAVPLAAVEPEQPRGAVREAPIPPAPVAGPPPPIVSEPVAAAPAQAPEVMVTKPVEVKVTETRLEIPERILFQSGTDELDASSIPVLDAVVRALRNNEQIGSVAVEGHTDSGGPADYNRTLSARRAETVKRYLIEKGVAAGRLSSRGLGPDRPIADNGTPEGRVKNRRVEFVIGDGTGR
jgi:outer membrane protein OmpA-like peptidoglycan-associated protein